MDTITHGLTGWLIARAIPADAERKEATAAVVLGSVLPDVDNVASLLGSELYLRIHRGYSHSFAGVAVSSLLVALLFYKYGKWKDLKKLYLLTLLGQLSHIALDLLNAYGTQIFQPFTDARVSFDLLFVVDLVFSGIIVAGLLLSRRRGPAMAKTALLVLGAYVGFAAVLHLRAENVVRDAAVRSGVRVVSSSAMPRLGEIASLPDLGIGKLAEAAEKMEEKRFIPGLSLPVERRGIPFPAGPFAWNGFIDDGSTYLRAEVYPVSGTVEWRERVQRGRDLPEVHALRGISDVRTYLWFARYPAVYASTVEGKTVLTFFDLRFGGVTGRRPFILRVIESPDHSPEALWGGS
ncbi:MAG: metal-dependent hydrolase [Deltaproteobacteria bacterium]|nr:metal-dependent hydrolase [Deltaproteobacteria bacterium]